MKKLLPIWFIVWLLLFASPKISFAQDVAITVGVTIDGKLHCHPSGGLPEGAIHTLDNDTWYWGTPQGDASGYWYFTFNNIPYGTYIVHIEGCDNENKVRRLTTGEDQISVNQPEATFGPITLVWQEWCSCGPTPSPTPSPSPSPSPGLPPDFFPSGSLTCTPDLVGDQDSRPYYNIPTERACDLCNLTGLFCPSCATSFTVFDEVKWQWKERDLVCEGEGNPDWKITPWEGTITIDPTQAKIPFVGKKGEESEQKYLADYFEGTSEYYEDYPMYWKDWIDYAGVWRKLSPMGYQDILKKQMVERALATSDVQPEGVHHYQLEYRGRICWDLPLLMDALLAFAQSRNIPGIDRLINAAVNRASYCIFEGSTPGVWAAKTAIDFFNDHSPLDITYFHTTNASDKITVLEGHYPPDPSEEDYLEKWNEWRESEWGRLWTVVPMFSHEDTPGEITPYLGSKPLDVFTINNPEAQVEKVPHVARLYESTQEVNNLLLPYVEENGITQKKSEPIIASAEKNVLGEKSFIAQAGSLSTGFSISLSPKGGNQYDLCWSVSGHASGACNYCDWGYCIQPYGFCEPRLPRHCWAGNPTLNCNMGSAHPLSITANPGDTVCATLNISSGVCGGPCCDPDPRQGFSKTACCQILEDGTPTCGEGPVEPPLCGLPEALPVNQCEMLAITDPNPNDDLCCEPINITLEAVDMFNDYPYTPCVYGCECCEPEKPPGCVLPCLCNPECNTWEYRTVNREIGINLLHPYLTEIWEQTGLAETAGLFNIFRPAKITEFREIDASSEITYTQSGFDSIAPSIGKFYFNYLGGVQLAKEWVTRALMPWKE